MIRKGMLEAEDQCRVHHRQPWSKEVNEVMTTANIIRIQLSSLRNNIDCSKQIEQKQQLLLHRIVLPTEIETTSIALRVAQKNCRTLIKEQRTEKSSMEEEQESAFVAMNPEIESKMAYSGCTSSALGNYLRAKEYAKEIIFMTKGVPHAGILWRMMIMSSGVQNRKHTGEIS